MWNWIRAVNVGGCQNVHIKNLIKNVQISSWNFHCNANNNDYSRLIVISATVSRIALKVLLCVCRPLGTSRVSPTICPLWGTKTCTPPPPRLSASSWRTWPITYEFAEFVSPLFFFLSDRNHFSHLYIYLSKAEIEGDRMFFDVIFLKYIFLFLQERQQLLSLAASKITNLQKKNLDDKFIICLNKVSKHFPPFMDRWVHSFPCSINQFIIDFNIVDFGILFIFSQLYESRVLHAAEAARRLEDQLFGVCVEPSRGDTGRIHAAEDVGLRPDDEPQVPRSRRCPFVFWTFGRNCYCNWWVFSSLRDEARQRMCLDIIHKILGLLTPLQLQELTGAVTAFVSHPSPVCRERMYDILMWIQDNYRSARRLNWMAV